MQTSAILLIAVLTLIVSACSPEERAADQRCIADAEMRFEVTPESDWQKWKLIVSGCNNKVNMYFDGWDVDPYVTSRDLNIEIHAIQSGNSNALREFYRDSLLRGGR